MIIEFVSKNYVAGEKLKDIITKKVERLDKFFDADQKVKVMLKQSNDMFILELTVLIDGGILRAEVSSDNMFNNIDLAMPKLEKQIIKHHTKLASKSKKFREKMITENEKREAEEQRKGVVKSKTYILTPMSVDDAIAEQELVGHSFYVFLNKATDSVNILYLRKEGDYGLIETVLQK